MSIKVEGHGPAQADVVIVGEAPGFDEELQGKPFVGASGQLLRTLLREAGIRPDSVYMTNVCKFRPPGNDIGKWITDKKRIGAANEWEERDGRFFSEEVGAGLEELLPELASRQPKVVVGVGNVALWALSGLWGVSDWRGSELRIDVAGKPTAFVPTLHPASILRSWPTRAQAAHDLRYRVARRLRSGFVTPEWDHNWTPTFEQVMAFLEGLDGDVAADVETSRGQIVCLGLATSSRRAMCIPFISENYGRYWTRTEQDMIVETLKIAMQRWKNIKWVWQNGNYDASYFDENWGFVPPNDFDTLIAQSVLFPGTPRGLGYLSSMYCDWHCFWKDDARDWSNLRDFEGLFRYNCRDVCATWEIAQRQREALDKAQLTAQFAERMTYSQHVYAMMARGVIRDDRKTRQLDEEIEEALHARKIIICDKAGREINPISPAQVSKLLYDDLGCRKPARRGKEEGGTGDKELEQIKKWHPEHSEVLDAVLSFRSLASVRNNFLRAELDPDGRLRSSFMTTGTETFRLTSSKNNFGRGTNLLNISAGDEKHGVPNYRKVIVPPSGCTYFDCDLARADVWIVAGDSGDEYLMQKLESDDVHYENAKDLFGLDAPSSRERQLAKTFVHLTNYGGSARTAAIAAGTTVHEADMAQRRWFAAHPRIKEWHRRIESSLAASRMVRNPFGYRMVFFDRVEGLLPTALAWSPQSAVAILTSLIHMAFDAIDGVTVALQMYDSLCGWYPTVEEDRVLPAMNAAWRIPVPYEKPLIIPFGLSTSTVSWGNCKDGAREWPAMA